MTPNEIGWARTVEKPIYLREDLHQMAKKKQFVTAAAAFAVAASAVAPAITADAATKTVRLSSDYVRVGDLDATLDKTYNGGEIHWYKSSVDLNKLGVFQTAKGFVKGQGIRVEKRVRVLNHAQEIKPTSEFVFEQGVPVSGIRVQPVLFADGVEYNKPLFVAGFSTEKVGEFEGTLTYSNKAYGTVTKTVKYKVVATEVEISNVSSSVDQAAEVLSVNADVKNLKDGEKVELVVYPGKDTSATPIKADATVKDGKLTVSKKLPAGTHSFQLVSGDVKTEIKDFTIEAPMVKDVKAINSKELTVSFNKAADKATLIDANGFLLAGKLTATGIDTANVPLDGARASLSADGMTLTLAPSGSFNGKYVVRLLNEEVKTAAGVFFPAYTSPVFTAEDTIRPTFAGVTYKATGEAVFSFSEPLEIDEAAVRTALTITGPTFVNKADLDVEIADDNKSFAIVLPDAMTKDANYTFALTGLKDFAGNIINPNPVTANVVKTVRDDVKPSATSIVATDANKVQVTFSEKIRPYASGSADNAVITASDATVNPEYVLDSTGTVATFTLTGPGTEAAAVRTVTVKAAKDLAGNTLSAEFSRLIQFAVDTVAPGYVSHEVVTEAGNRYLVVKFNEKLRSDIGTFTGSYVDSNSITKSLTGVGTPVRATDEMSVKIPLYTVADVDGESVKTVAPAGNYTLNLSTGFVEDVKAGADEGNKSVARSITFTLGSVVDSTKPVVLGELSQSADNKTITVNFDRDVTAATALNLANYSIDGVSSPFSGAIFKGNARTVELTLRDGSIATNGHRNYSIRNVATAAGSVMEVKNGSFNFKENVRPTVTSARVTAPNTIEITLSEAVNPALQGGDFAVFQGTSEVALPENTEVVSGNKVIITLAAPLSNLSGLAVKPESTIDLADLNGNLVNFTGQINVTN